MAQTWHYINLFSYKPTKVTSDFILNYLKKVIGGATQRAKITEKVHKPPRNHYIEWPVFSDMGLNCES